MEKTFPVSKYLSAVKKLLTTQVPPVWVNGVITQITERGRMVYLAIAEFAEGDVKPVAKLDLYLFAGEFAQMQARLMNLPVPFAFKEQIKVNLQVEADFYVGSGKFQCRVRNIDPNFTVGELAKTRKAILQRLEREGLLEKNKRLPFAELPLKVGLVTGEMTAAYKDFTTTLASSGFPFEVVTEFARMQGNETEATVLDALSALERRGDLDSVCIVRGGGAKTDLNYFDSESLCRKIAGFPYPVLTGIGHQIDESLVDKVAYASCITPTDCAKFLIARAENAKRALAEIVRQIANGTQAAISSAKERLLQAESRISIVFGKRIAAEEQKLHAFAHNLLHGSERALREEEVKLVRNFEGLRFGAQKIIALEKAKFELVETKVQANDPKRILSRGYSYTTFNGKTVATAAEIHPGDELSLHFADGCVSVIANRRN